MMTRNNIGFIGAGSITEAIVEGMISEKFVEPNEITLLNRTNSHRLEELKTTYSVHVTQDIQELVQQNRVIVLAMKPADAPDALSKIQPYIHRNHLIISVLAGITTTYIGEKISIPTPIVRVMPNTSATIGLSATAITGGAFASENDLLFTKRLFQTIGSVVSVSEDKLNAVTGLSGSGPAYFYYMVECMEKAAIQNGLDEEIARELILQTIQGAAMMLRQTKQPAKLLREKITSSGGTTQAGIATLKAFHFEEALLSCITDATNRSQDLGDIFLKQN